MAHNFANPRLIDVFGVHFTQEEVDFAIPKLHEDIPLYVDPFLLWASEKANYRVLHDRVNALASPTHRRLTQPLAVLQAVLIWSVRT